MAGLRLPRKCQYYGWLIGRWERFDLIPRTEVPDHAACYAVIFRGEVVYVGQTANLRERMRKWRIEGDYVFASPSGEPLQPAAAVEFRCRLSRKTGEEADLPP